MASFASVPTENDHTVSNSQSSQSSSQYTFTMASAKENPSKKMSIQERFALFRAKKLQESRLRKYNTKKGKRTQVQKDALRSKFLRQVESYYGVPYAQKYHDKGTKNYQAPLFLDCCALVRRAVNDLQDDFGFHLGRWNQNYQFSTLSNGNPGATNDPAALDLKDLKPGDLIFYTATYNSAKSRKQRLKLVHVEVFTGKGPNGQGTIGARWQKGVVQPFDSYKFESTSYHSIEFHYRSIDPWLDGMCKPASCHGGWWIDERQNMAVNKYSMFNADNDKEAEWYDDGSAGGDDEEGEGEGNVAAGTTPASTASVIRNIRRKSFFVGKSNGYKMIQSALVHRGWVQIPYDEPFNTKFDLRWVERRSQIDWLGHKDGSCSRKSTNNIGGKQLVNHIANNTVITVKTGLLNTLRDATRLDATIGTHASFPETYDLSIASDRLSFLKLTESNDDYVDSDQEGQEGEEGTHSSSSNDDDMWILKPSAMNRGRGIQVVRDVGPLRRTLLGGSGEEDGDHAMGIDCWKGRSMDMLAQRYLKAPMLVNGTRKFDIRAYCLVSQCDDTNVVAYYHEGYARVSLVDYTTTDASLKNNLVHLTNIAIQKKHPDYNALKNEAVLSMAGLEKVVECPTGWVTSTLENKMKSSMAAVISAASSKFDRKGGCFDLFGFDFMVTAAMEVVLIEVNTNPALHVSDGQVLEELLPKVVRGTLDIVLETHGAETPHESAQAARGDFDLIYNESKNFRFATQEQKITRLETVNEQQDVQMERLKNEFSRLSEK